MQKLQAVVALYCYAVCWRLDYLLWQIARVGRQKLGPHLASQNKARRLAGTEHGIATSFTREFQEELRIHEFCSAMHNTQVVLSLPPKSCFLEEKREPCSECMLMHVPIQRRPCICACVSASMPEGESAVYTCMCTPLYQGRYLLYTDALMHACMHAKGALLSVDMNVWQEGSPVVTSRINTYARKVHGLMAARKLRLVHAFLYSHTTVLEGHL